MICVLYKHMSPAKRALADYMSELSEGHLSAGWHTNLERWLWEAMTGVNEASLEPEEIAVLQALSSLCQGWVIWHEENEEGMTWVPLAHWLTLYNQGGGG